MPELIGLFLKMFGEDSLHKTAIAGDFVILEVQGSRMCYEDIQVNLIRFIMFYD